jgi:hypothetical protein
MNLYLNIYIEKFIECWVHKKFNKPINQSKSSWFEQNLSIFLVIPYIPFNSSPFLITSLALYVSLVFRWFFCQTVQNWRSLSQHLHQDLTSYINHFYEYYKIFYNYQKILNSIIWNSFKNILYSSRNNRNFIWKKHEQFKICSKNASISLNLIVIFNF